MDESGNLTCPECKEPYDLLQIARQSPSPATFKRILALTYTSKIVADRERDVALQAQNRELQSKYEALLSIKNEDDRTAAKLRLDIIDDILTLKCPRCKIAFCEYDGCAALTCGSNTCRCGFCAYCMKDCGVDAHAHISQCIENTKGIYLNLADFKVLHSRKRRLRIQRKLQSVRNDIR